MSKFKCTICEKVLSNYNGLAKHSARMHNIKGEELYMLHNNITKKPKCKCGCGEETNYYPGNGGWFGEWIQGHKSRVENFNTTEGINKSIKTRQKNWKDGKYTVHNKGKSFEQSYGKKKAKKLKDNISNNKARAKKISKALTGRKFSKEHIKNIGIKSKEYWSKPESKELQSNRRMQYIIENGLGYTSKLETKFAKLLDTLHIEYYQSFYVKDIKALYDFKIKGTNIIIEVDGDYWHCNPAIDKFKTPIHDWHFKNLERDKIKNKWAKENGYTLLRFWESDINNDIQSVTLTLLENLKKGPRPHTI